jgi:hypothetical protein
MVILKCPDDVTSPTPIGPDGRIIADYRAVF